MSAWEGEEAGAAEEAGRGRAKEGKEKHGKKKGHSTSREEVSSSRERGVGVEIDTDRRYILASFSHPSRTFPSSRG